MTENTTPEPAEVEETDAPQPEAAPDETDTDEGTYVDTPEQDDEVTDAPDAD